MFRRPTRGSSRRSFAAGATGADLKLTRWSEILVHLGGTGLRAGQPFAWRWRTLDSAPLDEAFGQSRSRWVPDDSGVVRIPAPPGRLALLFECEVGLSHTPLLLGEGENREHIHSVPDRQGCQERGHQRTRS